MSRRWIGCSLGGIALAISAVLSLIAPATHAVDRFQVDDQRNNLYLPYGVDTMKADDYLAERAQIRRPIQTFLTGHGDTTSSLYGIACNPAAGAETTADFSIMVFPGRKYFSETAISLTIADYGFYHAAESTLPGVVIGGYRHDSAFVVRILPNDTAPKEIFLSHGIDRDGDGIWRGRPTFVGAFDYDYDGHEDVFFWVDPVRDTEPRDLFCLDMDAGRIKWSLPVASGVFHGQIFSLHDSANPRLILSAYGMGQGARDSLFYSAYGYVAVVDRNGDVLHSGIASKFSEEVKLVALPGDTLFLLNHTLPMLASESEADTAHSRPSLSLIDRQLHIVKSIETPVRMEPWLADYDGDGKAEINIIKLDGGVCVFDLNLNLLAESDSTTLVYWQASLPSWGDNKEVAVIMTVRGSEVYTRDFHKLAAIGLYDYYDPLAYDSRGRMTSFIGGSVGHCYIARIVKRSWVKLVSVFYQDYQIWVLTALFSLAVGLIVMNLYRSRVSRQRRELALAHTELAETHEALKEAQQTIIAQEKFRQAKDIAGGFAHEIRNALFPADSSITKLHLMVQREALEPKTVSSYLDSVSGAIGRAVEITELISSYIKLDTVYHIERTSLHDVVAEVLDANRLRIGEDGVAIQVTGLPEVYVALDRRQLYMVINNLVLNSLDALTKQTNPAIMVVWEPQMDLAHLTISDNGCGMEPNACARVFDAFYSTKPYRGTGLGLTITKKIVEMYGGTISVTSEQTKGTRFDICLKLFHEES
jgi:signal transduction histidine kinase